MSTEPMDTTPTTGADNRSGDVPHGGFAPIVDLPEVASVATMPPPPVPAGAWNATAVDPDAADEPTEVSSGHFPPTTYPAPLPAATTTEDELDDESDHEAGDEAAVEQGSDHRVAPAVDHATDDGVVFFGDQPDPTPPRGWVSDDDSDLILPIEPARLVAAAPPAPVTELRAIPEPDVAYDDPADPAADDTPQDGTRDDVAAPHVADGRAVIDLAYDRVRRALGAVVGTWLGFFEDGATEVTLRPLNGPIVCLAGSELAGVMAAEPSDLFGASLELGVPHHVPLGISIPLHLVTTGPAASTTEVGDIVITAVGGALEFSPQLGDGIAEEIAKAFARDVARVSDEIDRRREERNVRITRLTLDSGGAIRIEVERR